MNWLDLGLIVLAIIFIIIGIRRGFMTSMLSHFSFSLNALLSFFLCKPIGFLYDKVFHVSGAIAGAYSRSLTAISENFSRNLIEIPYDQLSGFVKSTIDESGKSGLARWMFKVFLNKPSLYAELHESGLESRTMAEIISETYANFFTTIIAFVTSLILIYLMVLLFRLLAKKLRQVGFIRVVDNIFGAFYGLVRCLIILIIISCVIKVLSPISWMQPVTDYINGSFFGRLIYNQISNFFNNFLNFNDIIRAIIK